MIDIVLNEEAINKICPFYFLLDKDYRFIQFGRSFKIVFSQIIEGSNLYDHFSLKSSVHSILTEVVDLHSLFIMVSKDLGLEMKMIGIEIAKDKNPTFPDAIIENHKPKFHKCKFLKFSLFLESEAATIASRFSRSEVKQLHDEQSMIINVCSGLTILISYS